LTYRSNNMYNLYFLDNKHNVPLKMKEIDITLIVACSSGHAPHKNV